ncbi:MAG: hypothetical protein Q8L19_00095, partial [Reyranella sp.]|nr:hypothetical protein [Reyranella sp.]
LFVVRTEPISRPRRAAFSFLEEAMTDRNPAEILYPNQQANGDWKIELKYLPIAHRGHAFLALVRPDGGIEQELHGMAQSKHTKQIVPMGMDGADLVAPLNRLMGEGTKTISSVASGSEDEILKLWGRGKRAAGAITSQKFDYKAHDPSYELGTDGGEIQNSNSVAFTLGKAMGLDLSRALRDEGMTRTFSGWDRDLLDPKYKRYVTPPVFPVTHSG